MTSNPPDDRIHADKKSGGGDLHVSELADDDRSNSAPPTSGHSDADSQTQRNIDDESPG